MSTAAPPREPPARSRIDPRIRARRIEVRRTEGRRRLRKVGWLVTAAGAGCALWALTLTPALDVDHIRVDGAANTGTDAVLGVLDIRRGDALLTADLGAAARAVSSLPWVATADVRRSWPGTIEVQVVERTAVAAISAKGGGWVLVDLEGRQLALSKEPPVELVRVAGRPIEAELGTRAGARHRGAIDIAAALPEVLRSSLSSLWPKRDGSIEATVGLPGGGDAVVRFGRASQVEAKLVALAAVLERADLVNVRVIDLRVPGAPALTRG